MPTIHETLVELASNLADKMRDNVSQNNLPSVISDAISISNVEQDGSTYWIDVIVDVNKAPMAGAFEFGSGEHSPTSPARYRIPNEGNDWVAFPEDRWPGVVNPEVLPRLSDGRFVFRYVMHPGVEARPYIQPAIQEIRPELRKRIAQAVKAEILLLYGKTTTVINA